MIGLIPDMTTDDAKPTCRLVGAGEEFAGKQGHLCAPGERLQHHLIARAGDFLYIPANMPHLPYNLSDAESCVAVIARTDPNEQESVILLPELENRPDWRARGASLVPER